MRGGEEWQHEDVAIPEHMTAVRTAADATSSDRGLARVADRSHEVEEPEANGPLEVVITLDPDIGVRPPARPGRALLHQEPVEARRLGFVQGSDRAVRDRRGDRLDTVGRQSVEPSPRAIRQPGLVGGCDDPRVACSDAHRRAPLKIDAAGRDGAIGRDERRTDRHQTPMPRRAQRDGPWASQRGEAERPA